MPFWAIGAVFSPTNFRLAPDEVAFIVEDSAPVVLVHDAGRTAEIGAALSTAAHRPDHVVVLGGGQATEHAVSLASAPLFTKNTISTGSCEKATSRRAARRRRPSP